MDPTLLAFMSSISSLFGAPANARRAHTQQQFNQGQSQANPFGISSPFGNLGFAGNQAFFSPGAQQQGLMDLITQQGQNFLQTPADLSGVQNLVGQQNQFLQQPVSNTAFGTLGGLSSQAGQLGNMFAGNVQAGPQFGLQPQQQQLFGAGQNFLNQAQDQSGLIQQNLDAARALAAPQEQRQREQLQESIFGSGRHAVSGGGQQDFLQLLNDQSLADVARVGQAQQLGLQQQGQLASQGLNAFQQGGGLFGQATNRGTQSFANQLAGLTGQQQFGAGLEGQQFGQNMQQLLTGQTAGQQRLQNAINLFGLGEGAMESRFGMGQEALASTLGPQELMQQLFLGSLGADAQRIGAQSEFADANARLVEMRNSNSGFLGGLFG
jgi:hypothetical protein